MPDSPRHVFERLSQRISDGRWTELGELYAEDTVVEHPQHPPSGSRLEGRQAVADRFAALAGSQFELRARDPRIHETTDPEVIVAEYDYDGKFTHPFTCANIQVLRIRDGLIVHSRDYHDQLAMATARDGVAELAAAFGDGPELIPADPGSGPTAPAGTPRGAFERLVFGVCAAKWTEVVDLYADDAYVTHPFHPQAPPLRGREELRAHFAAAPEGLAMWPHIGAVHQTTDPEVIVGEFAYRGKSERPFQASNIFVLRVREGRIVESRDYADHVAILAAAGKLPH